MEGRHSGTTLGTRHGQVLASVDVGELLVLFDTLSVILMLSKCRGEGVKYVDDGRHGETMMLGIIHAGHGVGGQVRRSELGTGGSVLAATDHLDLRLLHDTEILVARCCKWCPTRRSATEDD